MPYAVLTDVSFATSCAVPRRIEPPLPTYGPSVPSRTTTKSISPGSREGSGSPGVELRRPQVDVVVQFEPQLQQKTALDVGVLQPRIAGHSPDRAEQDRVVLRDRGEVGIRERVTRLEETRGSEREPRSLESDAGTGRRGIQHLLRLGDDLRTDAVTRDDGKLHDTRHCSPSTRASVAASRDCHAAAKTRELP